MERNRIYSIRKGSVQWNEEDRLSISSLLIKCGYCVRIGREAIGSDVKKSTQYEYFIEYWNCEEGR